MLNFHINISAGFWKILFPMDYTASLPLHYNSPFRYYLPLEKGVELYLFDWLDRVLHRIGNISAMQRRNFIWIKIWNIPEILKKSKR